MKMQLMVLVALLGCETSISQWDAANMLAERHGVPVSSWCASADTCTDPVSDEALLDACLETLIPQCWTLFQ